MFLMRQWRDVVCVSWSELGKSLLNDCYGAATDYVADGYRLPPRDLPGRMVGCKEIDGCGDLCDSKPTSLGK